MRVRRSVSVLAAGLLPMAVAASIPARAQAGAVAGTISVLRDGSAQADASKVVVYLEDVPAPRSWAGVKKEIRQKDLAFRPELTVVVKGEAVEFPNEDRVFHNVFSVSEPAKFDLGLYKSGSSKTVTFKKAGSVDIYCNIHPQMVGKVKVLDNPYFAVTGLDGKFKISEVPPGTYPVVAWQLNGPESRGEVKVSPGGIAQLNLSVEVGKKPKWHLRKDGTPYGRYK